jgi:hypothetical protein
LRTRLLHLEQPLGHVLVWWLRFELLRLLLGAQLWLWLREELRLRSPGLRLQL